MTFRDLREFFDGTLALPVGGKTYTVPPCSADDGLWAQALMDAALKAATGGEVNEDDLSRIVLNDDDERSLYQRLLGTAFDEMKDDGVDWPSIARCGQTAFVFFTQGEDAAQVVWEQQPGEAPAPNRETRRQESKASAVSTPRRGSTSGTRSRTTSKRALPAA